MASTFFGTTCPPHANINTDSEECFDVSLDGGTLTPGSYQIAITAFENMSLAENLGSGTLADGFTGLGNLADGEDLHYAFDVGLSPAKAVPEPSAGWLMGWALLAAAVRRRIKMAGANCTRLAFAQPDVYPSPWPPKSVAHLCGSMPTGLSSTVISVKMLSGVSQSI